MWRLSEPDLPQLDVRAFFQTLRRRLWVVLLVPALSAGAAYAAASAQTSLYRSSAEILIGRSQAETIFDPLRSTSGSPDRTLANQIRLIQSHDVRGLVRERLGYGAEVEATASRTEDVITLTAIDPDPRRAAAIVDSYAQAYLDYRRASGARESQTSQAELRRQIDVAEARLAALDQEVARRQPDAQEQARTAQANERLPLLAQIASQRAQLAQLEAAANVDRGGAQLLAPAPVPGAPFEPNPRRDAVLGLGVGLVLGLGLALLLDVGDNRIRGKEQLEALSGKLPVLGLIPVLSGWRNAKTTHVASIEDPTSASAEAYRSLRTSIQFLGLDRSLRTIQVTSPAMSEGKTTTLVNLAVALASAGRRVVIVDGDLRRPRVHEFFGVDGRTGFTSVLVGDAAGHEVLRPVVGVPGLVVVPCGPLPPNPAELLSRPKAQELLASLQGKVDLVLVDSPPVLPVSDAVALSTKVDGTLMVVSAKKTKRNQLVRALELLNQVDANVIGTVLNRAGGNEGYESYGYGYRPYARPSPPHAGRRARRQADKAANGNAGSRGRRRARR